MRLLLDTHVLLWLLSDPERLGETVLAILRAEANEVRVSAATAWEIAIKKQMGKLRAPDDLEAQLEAGGVTALPITLAHARLAGSLPAHHRDPFDRMLIAQATIEGLTVVTHDPHFKPYGVPLLLV